MVNILCYTVVWGPDVQCMQAQRTNEMGHSGSIYIRTKDQSYGPMGTQSMYKRTILGTREWYRSSVHKPTQKCTQLNGIDPVHVTKCGVRVCHHHQTGVLCATCTVREQCCNHVTANATCSW